MRFVAGVVLCFCISVCSLFAQGTTSRVVGTVTDPSGAPVAGAKIKLANEGTSVSFDTTTNESGIYQFEAIQIGTYTIEIEGAGFKKFVTKGNQLTVGSPMTVNATLQIGQLAETIEVSGTAELVQTSQSGNLGPVVNQRTIEEMPIIATRRRDPTSILAVTPGMNQGVNSTGGGGHMNGSRDRAWNFTLDGIDMNETSAGGGIGNNPIRVNPDSVAELRIVTSNASAEFGRNSGAQVSMVTRSGTNEIHGNAFWYYRTPSLNANPWANNLLGLGKEMFVQNIYGGSVGGPIIKNRTFYFANWQELRAIRNITQTATVLTQSARQGLFRYVAGGQNFPAGTPRASVDFQGNPIVPVATYNMVTSDPQRLGLDPTIKALVDQTPLPIRFDLGDGLNTGGFVFRPTETEKQRDLTFKVDHVINDTNTVFGRIYWGFQDTICDSVNGGLPRVPDAPCLVDTKRKPRNYAFNWRTTPKSTVTNEFVVGWSEFFFDFPNPVQDLDRPTISSAFYTIPVAYTYNNTRKLQTLQFVDNLSWFRGKHALKFGINFRLTQHSDDRGSIGGLNSGLVVNTGTSFPVSPDTYGIPQAQMNAIDFTAARRLVHFNLGIVENFNRGFVADGDQFVPGTFRLKHRWDEYDFYVQDTWKVRKNLTIDLGLRLDARLAPSGVDGDIFRPDFVPVAGAAPRNNLRWAPGKLWNSDWNNFGPTVGLAWDPFGRGKTSVRANYRLAFDRVPTFLVSSFILPNMPGSTLGVTDIAFGQANGRLRNLPALTPTRRPSELRQPIPFSANSNTVVDPNFETPQTNMWSFGIQHEVAANTLIEVNYLGRRAHNLLGGYNANQAVIRENGFLDAFRAVQAGGESVLFDRIFAADPSRRAGESGAALARRLFPANFQQNNVGGLAATIAQRTAQGTNVTDASGLGPYFFFPYPQFSGGMFVVDSNDFSTYHSLQVNFSRRFARGANVNVSYVWAKSLDTRSFDPAFTLASSGAVQSASSTPFDINNRRLNYGISDFDRTHSLFSNFVYELPFGRNQWIASNAGGVLNRIIGGWQVAGLFRITSGLPFTVYSGVAGFNSVVNSFANCNGCDRSQGAVRDEGGFKWYFDPAERAQFSIPVAGDIGNTGRNYFRGPRFFNLDFSLAKKTNITERIRLELRADASNVTNTPSFGPPTTTFTSTLFGRIGTAVASGPRQIMLGSRLIF
ncbi:MAG: TonB-dependent receptor [Bryobacteraceae bacterium]|nr:TonB-dependent receptor [Bryobacteraceae bacterium]